jgi:hypothetical protein
MSNLNRDIFYLIFKELQDDGKTQGNLKIKIKI